MNDEKVMYLEHDIWYRGLLVLRCIVACCIFAIRKALGARSSETPSVGCRIGILD